MEKKESPREKIESIKAEYKYFFGRRPALIPPLDLCVMHRQCRSGNPQFLTETLPELIKELDDLITEIEDTYKCYPFAIPEGYKVTIERKEKP